MRLAHIDIARGLCILLVVLGHNTLSTTFGELKTVLGSFRMPLMFFLAGIFLRPGTPWLEQTRHKADALLKPLVVTALIYAPYSIAFQHESTAANYLMGVLTAGSSLPGWLFPLWFLPQLWLVATVSQWLVSAFRFDAWSRPAQCLAVLSLLASGAWLMRSQVIYEFSVFNDFFVLRGMPFSLDILPLCSAYFLAGFALRDNVRKMRFSPDLLALCLTIFAATHIMYSCSVNLFLRRYDDVVMSTVAAASGIGLLLCLAAYLSRHEWISRWLTHVGSNSLLVLIFHAPLQSLATRIMAHEFMMGPWLSPVLGWVIGVAGCLLAASVIRRSTVLSYLYLPIKGLKAAKPTKSSPMAAGAPSASAIGLQHRPG